jgi:L-ascorbate metabolism protein UlaG (beta-lactamase superfamily)
VPAANASSDRVVFVGHSTALIELDGVRLLTDPLLGGRVAHLRRHGVPVDARTTARPDAVLISHVHHDHLDLASLRTLGEDTPLLVPAGAGAWLRRKGFRAVTELRAGEATRVGALRVGAVEARHDGRRLPMGLRAETVGYVVSGRQAVYFAGDTELFDGMATLASDLDVALVPIWGWGTKLGPGHLDPLDAARAIALLRPRIAVPVHWGTFLPIGLGRRLRANLHDPPHAFAEHVARLAPDVEVRILAPGEATPL